MSTPNLNPRVGVAAVISDPDGRVIFGLRKGSHGAGSLPPDFLVVPGLFLIFRSCVFSSLALKSEIKDPIPD